MTLVSTSVSPKVRGIQTSRPFWTTAVYVYKPASWFRIGLVFSPFRESRGIFFIILLGFLLAPFDDEKGRTVSRCEAFLCAIDAPTTAILFHARVARIVFLRHSSYFFMFGILGVIYTRFLNNDCTYRSHCTFPQFCVCVWRFKGICHSPCGGYNMFYIRGRSYIPNAMAHWV